MAHTPGPWYPGHLGEGGKCQCRTIVDDSFAGGIATVHLDNGIASIEAGGNDQPPLDQAIANMHLIAAAPELYAALHRIVDSVARTTSGDVCQTDDFEDAKAALAKARGESKE